VIGRVPFTETKNSIPTCVRRRLICELQLTKYYVDTSSSSAFICRQVLLVIDRPACFATSAYRQPLPRFPLTDLPELLEDVPLAVKARMRYMHHSAPAHTSGAVRDVLNNTYHDRWIGRGEPAAWPPRSTTDLNPLDFYQ
jgi:hypothetical protein